MKTACLPACCLQPATPCFRCAGLTVQASGLYTLTVEPIAAAPGPQACNSSSEASAYLPVRQGSLVLLGRQRPVNGDDGWNAGMTPYVGRQRASRRWPVPIG